MDSDRNSDDTQANWRPWKQVSLNLTTKDVYVWRTGADLTQVEAERNLSAIDAAERLRAANFLRTEDRNRFVAGRSLLRRVLACCLGCVPSDLVFAADRFGKPQLADPQVKGLDFNISHSGGYVLLALAKGRRVGVDTEEIRGGIDIPSIMRDFFTPGEKATIISLSGKERAEAFFWYWTRKEALAKAIGSGLGAPLGALDVSTGTAHGWEVRTLEVGPCYRAAVAAFGSDWRLSCWDA